MSLCELILSFNCFPVSLLHETLEFLHSSLTESRNMFSELRLSCPSPRDRAAIATQRNCIFYHSRTGYYSHLFQLQDAARLTTVHIVTLWTCWFRNAWSQRVYGRIILPITAGPVPAGCRKRQLNLALSVHWLILGLFRVCFALFTRVSRYFVFFFAFCLLVKLPVAVRSYK